MWNIDTDCLGDLQLPNLLDEMRSDNAALPSRAKTGWRFDLQKLPATEEQKMLASSLVQTIKRREGKKETKKDNEPCTPFRTNFDLSLELTLFVPLTLTIPFLN